jgi:hypothetical protein
MSILSVLLLKMLLKKCCNMQQCDTLKSDISDEDTASIFRIKKVSQAISRAWCLLQAFFVYSLTLKMESVLLPDYKAVHASPAARTSNEQKVLQLHSYMLHSVTFQKRGTSEFCINTISIWTWSLHFNEHSVDNILTIQLKVFLLQVPFQILMEVTEVKPCPCPCPSVLSIPTHTHNFFP